MRSQGETTLGGTLSLPAALNRAYWSWNYHRQDICEELCRQEDFIRREEAMNSNTDIFTRTYSFRHALYRQVFYDRQGPIRLVGAHRKIGERLEASYPIERRGEIAAEVIAAQPLSETQLALLSDQLRRSVGRRVSMDARVDPGLIGGMIVKVGSRMVDGSLKSKLQRLQQAMKGVG